MDDIKISAKNEKGYETLIQTIKIYSQDIKMKSSIEKYDMPIMENGQREITEGIELPNASRKGGGGGIIRRRRFAANIEDSVDVFIRRLLFQVTKWRNVTRRHEVKNWISFNSSTERCHKD